MYGLPKDFDGSIFVSRELDEISFTVNSIIFSFGSGVSITVESGVKFGNNQSDPGIHLEPPVKSSDLMVLIGKSVVGAKTKDEGTLELRFSNGEWLAFIDDSAQYESYHINIFGKEITV